MQALNGKEIVEFEDFQLDAGKNVLRRNGEVVSLPLKAVELLSVLVENRGDVVSKDELMSRVWAGAFVEDSVLTQNIYLLRKTLNASGAKDLIKTVPRRGYFFNGEIRDAGSYETAVLERHLVEEITVDFEEQETRSRPKSRLGRPVLIGIAVLPILLAAGLYYYFAATENAPAGAPPLKIGPLTNASGYKTLAVLPFRATDEPFGKSFAADLAVRLGAANKFAVVSPVLLDEYAKHAAELRTDFAMRGEVEANAGQYSATVRFVDTGGGEIWSDKFEFDNLIQLQDAIANRTVKEIAARLTEPERELTSKRLPSNVAAFANYQTGYALWRRRAGGVQQLRKSIELDQSFAPAYAILASAVAMGGLRGSPAADDAQKLLDKAFLLDENLADAYAVQGFIRIFHHRDWPGAEGSLKTALRLDPNNVNARHWLGVYYSIHRRLDEAKAEMNTALGVDPTNPTLLADLGQIYYFAGELRTAGELCERSQAIDPQNGFGKQCVSDVHGPSAAIDPDAMLSFLEQTPAEQRFGFPYLNVDPKYDAIRSEPRFVKLLNEMNLP